MEALSQDPRFLRFLFTALNTAGIYNSTYGSKDHLAFAEGRRSLGFDMLRTVELVRPDAHLAILQAETSALMEYPDGRSARYDSRDELADPDGPVGVEGRKPGSGLQRYELVDYTKPVGGDAASG
jgi:hypothetical protein